MGELQQHNGVLSQEISHLKWKIGEVEGRNVNKFGKAQMVLVLLVALIQVTHLLLHGREYNIDRLYLYSYIQMSCCAYMYVCIVCMYCMYVCMYVCTNVCTINSMRPYLCTRMFILATYCAVYLHDCMSAHSIS